MASRRFVIRQRTAIVVGLVTAFSVAACSGADQSDGIDDADHPETVSTTPTSVGEHVVTVEIEMVDLPVPDPAPILVTPLIDNVLLM